MSATLQARRASVPFPSSARHPGALALSVMIAMLAWPAAGQAACPVGDPSVVYCEEFAGNAPLANYTILNPIGGNQRFEISVLNQALVFQNAYPGLAFAWVLSNPPQNFRNSLFEADLRFDTADPWLRSAMAITWANQRPPAASAC